MNFTPKLLCLMVFSSYLHCEWRTADELLIGDKRVLSKIKRFKMKRMQSQFSLEVTCWSDEGLGQDLELASLIWYI
jgi:hypothetical protein